MTLLLVCSAVLAVARPTLATPTVGQVATSNERYEYWLYPANAAGDGNRRWGVITGATVDDARSILAQRQATQQRWRAWMGLRNDAADEPFAYDNAAGPFPIRRGQFRIAPGVTTNNVWATGTEEAAARRRAAEDLSAIRSRLDAAREVLADLMPLGEQTVAAAGVRGRTLFLARPIAEAYGKVREAEAVLQMSQGATLADLMVQMDEVANRLRLFASHGAPAPLPPSDDAAIAPTNAIAPAPATEAPASPPPVDQGNSGAVTLVPTSGGVTAPRPKPVTPAQGSRVLLPQGSRVATGSGTVRADDGIRVVQFLNEQLGNYFRPTPSDPVFVGYTFDREGVTIRRQQYANGQFAPQPPERIPFAAIGNPDLVFLPTDGRTVILYGDKDLAKARYRPLVHLPEGTNPDDAKRMLQYVRHLIAPSRVPVELPAAPGTVATVTEAEANARIDAALSGLRLPKQIVASDLIPSVLPEWMRNLVLARVVNATTSKELASTYSDFLAEGAVVTDDAGQPATLAKVSESILGEAGRASAPERVAWTVTGFEERNGSMEVTLQCSLFGRNAADPTQHAIHGAKVIETWAVVGEGPILQKLRVVRAHTVTRSAAPAASDIAARHREEAVSLSADGRPLAAHAAYLSAIRISPEDPSAWQGAATTAYQLGRNPDSLACFRIARDLDPKNVVVTVNYATVLRNMGDVPTSVAASRLAVDLDPASLPAREALAVGLFLAQDYVGATTQYAEAVKLAPQDARLRANYASALLRSGKRKEALVEAKASYATGFRNHWVFGELKIR